MLTRSFFALFILVLRQNALGSLLGCNVCDHLLIYNYILTDIVPSDLIRGCALRMSQRSCSIDVQFDFDNRKTILNVTGSHEYVETSIIAITSIENGLKHKRHVSFWCADEREPCNTVAYLERVLRSITFNGSFDEFEPLLTPTNQTLDCSSCFISMDTNTTECQTEVIKDTKACYIESSIHTDQSSDVCAHCSSMNDYHLMHSMTFFVNNISIPQSESLLLSCALPQCNSFANLQQIRQLVTIDFNATSFFDTTTTTTIISPTTTSTMSSGSTCWNNGTGKHFFVFTLFIISLTYEFSK